MLGFSSPGACRKPLRASVRASIRSLECFLPCVLTAVHEAGPLCTVRLARNNCCCHT